MTSTFVALFEAEAATMTRIYTPDATDDPEYGSDLSCTDDIDPSGKELAGNDPRLIVEACYRRLITARGTLIDDPDYGLDLNDFLQLGMTRKEIMRIPGMVTEELRKDDRIEELSVKLANITRESFDILIRGTCAKGPFTLTMALTDSGALIQEMTP